MNVLIFGASGSTGQRLVSLALTRDLSVTAFVRRPGKLTVRHERLRVVTGDVIDAEAVADAIGGHDAVVSALGVGKPLKSDPVVVAGVQNIVDGMRASGVNRLIYLSFIGVGDSRAAAGPMLRFAARVPLRHEIADHVTKEQLVSTSLLAWTIVRPPKMTNGRFTGAYRSGEDIVAQSFLPTLSRADVADFMIRQLADASYLRKVVRLLP